MADMIKTKRGTEYDLNSDVVGWMDDEIREQLHSEMAPCSPQAFFDAYCQRHEERFGEKFPVEDF